VAFEAGLVTDVVLRLCLCEPLIDLDDSLIGFIGSCLWRRLLSSLHGAKDEACDSYPEHKSLYFHFPVSIRWMTQQLEIGTSLQTNNHQIRQPFPCQWKS
jgi:hypothetical protein